LQSTCREKPKTANGEFAECFWVKKTLYLNMPKEANFQKFVPFGIKFKIK